jgi:hypothetical protein
MVMGMARMTDIDELLEKVAKIQASGGSQEKRVGEIILAITNAPTVEVVRCKDCKHGIWDEEEQMWECVLEVDLNGDLDTYSMFHEYNDGEHFCSYGERKTDG